MKSIHKGMYLTVIVDEQLYKEGVSELRDSLIGRIIHVCGDKPVAHETLVTRLGDIWGIKTPWSLTPLGEGYYNMRFSYDADMEKFFARRLWQLKPGLLRLQRWVPDFNPFRVNTSVVQAWIRISELPLEYWNKHIITALASAVGTVIKIDERTLSRTMGCFARVLVDLDLKHDREETLMFELEGHCSFVSIQYERLPDFCKFCSVIGHTTRNCGGDSRKKKLGMETIISKSKEERPAEAVKGPVGGTKQWVQKHFTASKEGATSEPAPAKETDSLIQIDAQPEEQPTLELGAVSEIDPKSKGADDMVTITQAECLQVHLPPVEGVESLAISHTVLDNGGTGDPSKGRKASKAKAPALTKYYNLRNRILEETPHVEVVSHAPGPGLVILENNSTRPLQVMRNVAREKWGDCVDDLPRSFRGLSMKVISSSEQVIMVRVQHELLDCTFGFIHAASDYINRRALWSFISDLSCSNLCLVGDFNAVLGAHERISSRAPNGVSCAEFQGFIEQEGLIEIEAAGAKYTWGSRRTRQGLIASKLDRIIAQESFVVYWDSISVAVLTRAGSDHHPILLHCTKGMLFQPRPFKFQASWILDSRFREVVRHSWGQLLRPPDPISRVIQKLKRLKGDLRTWNKQVFGRIDAKVAVINQSLSEI
ncbi:hypothetical protein ACS0TY_020687 [Phlomoides rotata]